MQYYYLIAGETVGATVIESLIIIEAYIKIFNFDLEPIPQWERFDPNHVEHTDWNEDDEVTEEDMELLL